MHPRNRHKEYLDYWDLAEKQPSFKPFVFTNAWGGASIDYTDDAALRELTKSLLAEFYGVVEWSIPEGHLVPPVPQRVDYLHHLADLLAPPGGSPPRGAQVRGLDVGAGAGAIYCLLGARAYGWSFVGTDIDKESLKNARAIIRQNGLDDGSPCIQLRRQRDLGAALAGVVRGGESFAFSMCNPPFHESLEHAARSASTKWERLGRGAKQGAAKNYQGRPSELWCEGGEVGFIGRMAEESSQPEISEAFIWFSSLISRWSSIELVHKKLDGLGVKRRELLTLRQGRSSKWVVAWTFLDPGALEKRLVALARETDASPAEGDVATAAGLGAGGGGQRRKRPSVGAAVDEAGEGGSGGDLEAQPKRKKKKKKTP